MTSPSFLTLPSPLPTAPPAADLVLQRLQNRQNAGPQVCGLVSGNTDQPVTCASGYSCAIDTVHSVHGCCTVDTAVPCTVYTVCFDYTQGGVIGGYTLACPATIPYCYTRYWDTNPPLSGFGCAASPFTVLGVQTLPGENVVLGTSTTQNSVTSAVPTQTFSSSSSSTTTSSSDGSGSSSQGSITTTTSPSNGSGSSSQSGTTPTTSSPLSAGAIAGIAIGSALGALIVGLILRKLFRDWVDREHRKKMAELNGKYSNMIGNPSTLTSLGEVSRPPMSVAAVTKPISSVGAGQI